MSEIVTDQRDQPAATMFALLVTVFTLGYMLPWMVAAARGKANHWGVFWLNLLLGWTIIGWVGALVMSVLPHRPIGVYQR